MSRVAPCKNCVDKRHPGCHAKCKEYADWKDEDAKDKKSYKKAKDADDLVRGYMAQTAEQYRKKENKAKKVFRNGR